MSTKTVSIVDEDIRNRAALAFALSGCRIHAEPFDGLDELAASKPKGGVILVHDTGDTVAAVARWIVQSDSEARVIAYASDPATARIVAAVRSGASDYLNWPCEAAEIVEALGRIEEENAPPVANQKFAWASNPDLRLTPREREVLACAAEGLPNKEIGRKLNISPRTVEVHRSRALHKIGAKNIAEAMGAVFGLHFAA